MKTNADRARAAAEEILTDLDRWDALGGDNPDERIASAIMRHCFPDAPDTPGRMADDAFAEYERYTSAYTGDLDEIMAEARRARDNESTQAAEIERLKAELEAVMKQLEDYCRMVKEICELESRLAEVERERDAARAEADALREAAESWRLEQMLAQRGWFRIRFTEGWSIQRRLGNGATEPLEPSTFYDTPEAAVRAAAKALEEKE